MDNHKEELFSDYLEILFQKQLKISELFALVRKVLENKENHFILKDQLSIELFQDLWLKEEILLMDPESEESQSTEKNSQMKTSI